MKPDRRINFISQKRVKKTLLKSAKAQPKLKASPKKSRKSADLSTFVLATLAAFLLSIETSSIDMTTYSKTSNISQGPTEANIVAKVQAPAPVAVRAPASLPVAAVQVDRLAGLEKEFEEKKIQGIEKLEREEGSSALRVTLSSDQLFMIGSAKLDEKSQPVLKEIVELLKTAPEKTVIEVEGHTDDSPVVHQRRIYGSNWELSAARAASLVHVFEEQGFTKGMMKVIGYGDSRPLLPNRSVNGEAILSNLVKNRRIVLRIYQEEAIKKPL